jgi:hypothetical protein
LQVSGGVTIRLGESAHAQTAPEGGGFDRRGPRFGSEPVFAPGSTVPATFAMNRPEIPRAVQDSRQFAWAAQRLPANG